MKSFVLASLFLNFVQVVFMRIELEDFYPYGPQNGDNSVPKNDDGSSGRVNIVFPFPFFDEDHDSLFVSSQYIKLAIHHKTDIAYIAHHSVNSDKIYILIVENNWIDPNLLRIN